MRIYISLDSNNNRLQGWSSTKSTDNIELEIDENHEVLRNPFVYKYENGELIKDVEYQQQLIQERETRKNQPTIEERIDLMGAALDDLILGGM